MEENKSMTAGNVFESFCVLDRDVFTGNFFNNVSVEKLKVCTGRICNTNL